MTSCWTLTTGEIGMRHQAEGLAKRLGLAFVPRLVQPRRGFDVLPPALAARLGGWATLDGKVAEPPWPDVAISCGRRSIPMCLALKHLSGGITNVIHVQNTKGLTPRFDAVVVPEHDGLQGRNVLPTLGAVHHLTLQDLEAARPVWASRWGALPKPWIAVLVGGASPHNAFTVEDALRLGIALGKMQERLKGSVLITTSRRTGVNQAAALRQALTGTNIWVWDNHGDNPYVGLLACADIIVNTADSISMCSEAALSGTPLLLWDMGIKKPRQRHFYQSFVDRGIARWFTPDVMPGERYPPLDETGRVAKLLSSSGLLSKMGGTKNGQS